MLLLKIHNSQQLPYAYVQIVLYRNDGINVWLGEVKRKVAQTMCFDFTSIGQICFISRREKLVMNQKFVNELLFIIVRDSRVKCKSLNFVD